MEPFGFLMTIVLVGLVCGAIGYALGRDGLIENTFWTKCVFSGNPPEPYKNWRNFAMSKVKEGVFIRAATKEDYR